MRFLHNSMLKTMASLVKRIVYILCRWVINRLTIISTIYSLILYHIHICVKNARKLLHMLIRGTRTWIIMLFRLISFAALLGPGWYRLLKYWFLHPLILRNVEYGKGAKYRNLMDIYLPINIDEHTKLKKNIRTFRDGAPIVIFVSGGAWIIGYKLWSALVGRGLAAFGILTIVPDYRNFPQGDIEDMVVDIRAAVKWTVQNAHRFGGNPEKIVLAGQSAGAHICLCLLVREFLRSKGQEEEHQSPEQRRRSIAIQREVLSDNEEVTESIHSSSDDDSDNTRDRFDSTASSHRKGSLIEKLIHNIHNVEQRVVEDGFLRSDESDNDSDETAFESCQVFPLHNIRGEKEKSLHENNNSDRPSRLKIFENLEHNDVKTPSDRWFCPLQEKQSFLAPRSDAPSTPTPGTTLAAPGAERDIAVESNEFDASFLSDAGALESSLWRAVETPTNAKQVNDARAENAEERGAERDDEKDAAATASESEEANVLRHIKLYIGVSGPYNLSALTSHLHNRGLDASILTWICRGDIIQHSPTLQLAKLAGHRWRNKEITHAMNNIRHSKNAEHSAEMHASLSPPQSPEANTSLFSLRYLLSPLLFTAETLARGLALDELLQDFETAMRADVQRETDADVQREADTDDPLQDAHSGFIEFLESNKALEGFPPVFLVHGSADQSIPAEISTELAEVLQRSGGKVQCKVYQGWSHTDAILEAPMVGSERLFSDMVRAINTHTNCNLNYEAAENTRQRAHTINLGELSSRENSTQTGSSLRYNKLWSSGYSSSHFTGKKSPDDDNSNTAALAPKILVKIARQVNPF